MKCFRLLCFLMACGIIPSVFAQGDSTLSESKKLHPDLDTEVALSLNGTSNGVIPFWIKSNQYGSVPLSGVSASLYGRIAKEYKPERAEKLLDWGGAVDIRLNGGSKIELIPIEAYLKGRLSIFQLKIGRSRDREGLVDSALSSGSFTWSGNAPGIPKVELSIPSYWSLPWTNEVLAIKGNISYGWMGKVPLQYGENFGSKVPTNYHHLSFYGRIGKPEWKWKLFGAINHDVIWGSDELIFGDQYDLSDLEAFWYVLTGAKYTRAKDISKIGNHLGSLDVGGEYDFPTLKLGIYRQFFYEKGAIGHFANLKDGLNGISLTNKKQGNGVLRWNSILAELFYSKHQAGEAGAKQTPSGPEYYYNHAIYPKGFSYKGSSMGTPLIIAAKDARDDLVNHPANYFISNRVVAFHLGASVDIMDWTLEAKTTFAKHYGDFRTSGPNEQWFNGKRITQDFRYGKFSPVNQFSGYLEANRPLNGNYYLAAVVAADFGGLLYDNVGTVIKIGRTF